MFDFNIDNTAFETTATVNSNKVLAHAFIERLAHDDDFRQELTSDPAGAAAQYGFTIDSSRLPADGINLPSKEMIQGHLGEIAEKFAAQAHVVIFFQI